MNSRRIPLQGGPPFGGGATAERYGGAVRLPAFGGGDGGSRPRSGEDVHTPPSEHPILIHHCPSNIRYMYGGGSVSGSEDITEMVGFGEGGGVYLEGVMELARVMEAEA